MPLPDDNTAPGRSVLTPSALTRLVRGLLEDALPPLWIEGELCNVSRPASGHVYFTLKDATAQVRCAMFRSRAGLLRFRPVDGMQVLLRGRVGLYEARGEFQLVADHMEPAGEGALRRQLEELKARLQAEGLFDSARKRALPRHARRIGVVTSPTGAAIRDVLSVLARRWPLARVEVLPVPVQGREAPPAIAAMLRKASACGRYDVLLLTRGGGSLEDLMAFSDEAVARAVHASAVPVVCAVGHEIDFSVADFVADLRAATPSAAAELLVPDAMATTRHLDQLRRRLAALPVRRLQVASQQLDRAMARLQSQRPQARLARDGERLARLHHRLLAAQRDRLHAARLRLERAAARFAATHPRQRLPALRRQLEAAERSLRRCQAVRIERERLGLRQVVRALQAVSPLATLDRGYAIVFGPDGQVVRSPAQAPGGTVLRIRLQQGEIDARVD